MIGPGGCFCKNILHAYGCQLTVVFTLTQYSFSNKQGNCSTSGTRLEKHVRCGNWTMITTKYDSIVTFQRNQNSSLHQQHTKVVKYPRELWRTPYYLSIDLSFCQRGKEYYYYIRSYGRATSAASYDKKHSSQFPSACKTWRSRRHLSLPLILTNDSSCQDITGPLFQQNITGRMCHCCIHFHLIHNTTGIRILCHYPLVSNN